MNRLIPSFASVVAVLALAAGAALEHRTRVELRQEQDAVQQQLNRLTERVAQNEQQASLFVTANAAPFPAYDSSAELARLQSELAVFRELTNQWEHSREENAEAHAALEHYLASEAVPQVATADFWPRTSWSFAGFGTPDDALRSSLWASDNGDLKVLFNSLTGELRQFMEKEFEGKSPDEAAIRAMEEVAKLKSVEVLNRDFQSGDTTVLTAAIQNGDQTNTTKFVMKKVGNEWKLASANDHE